MTAGEQLRAIRERLGLSLRMVENASGKLAAKHENADFLISLSRLSDIETKGIVPSLYRLYSLSVIYRVPFEDLLRLFGINLSSFAADLDVVEVPITHLANFLDSQTEAEIPLRLDPGFQEEATSAMARMIERWGTVPLTFLKKYSDRRYTYGYIGSDDWAMYPLIIPGSFVQIDEAKRRVQEGRWRSEYERPIYFVETRQGFSCSWCEINGPMLTLTPHPMSSVKSRSVRLGSEAEIVGQVVGVAMRLDSRNETTT